MLGTSKRFGLAAAALLAAALGVGIGVWAQAGDDRAAFRRPAALDAGRAATPADPVWSLGQKLFFDTRLSGAQTLSCASCHQPDTAWTDHLPRGIGEARKAMAFRTATLLDAGQIDRYGWSGRFVDIPAVTFFALQSPANMNMPLQKLVERLRATPDYGDAFRAAFPDGAITKQNIGAAFTRFVASITADGAPFDRWVAGDEAAIGDDAKRGFALFTRKGRCFECHKGWALTDGAYRDIGTGRGADIGRGQFFKTSAKLQYAFKTPTLRNVAERAPYMHDGSLASLEAVIDHYDKGGLDRPSRDAAIRPLHLTPSEKADLVAFLKTLTGGTRYVVAAPGG